MQRRWRKMLFLAWENFEAGDFFVTLTYDDDHLPPHWRDAEKKMPAYLRKVREARKALGLDYRYMYVDEHLHTNGRPHHHMLIKAADGDEKLLRDLWPHGHVEISRIRPDRRLEPLINYIAKEEPLEGKRAWKASRNILSPRESIQIVPPSYRLPVPLGSRPWEKGTAMQYTEAADACINKDIVQIILPRKFEYSSLIYT